MDYQAISAGPSPASGAPDSMPVLRIGLRSGKVDTVANLARQNMARRRSENRSSRPRKSSRRTISSACSRTAARGWPGATRTGWTGCRRKASGRAARAHYTKSPSPRPTATGYWPRCASMASSSGCRRTADRVSVRRYQAAVRFRARRPNGEVWLQRPRAREEAPLTYDVFDRKTLEARSSSRKGRRWRVSAAKGRSTRHQGFERPERTVRAAAPSNRRVADHAPFRCTRGASQDRRLVTRRRVGPWRSVRRRSRRRPSSYHRRVISPARSRLPSPNASPTASATAPG